MKTQLLIIFALVVILLGFCEVQAGVVNPNSVVVDDIAYYFQTDKFVYNLDEEVEMLFRATNLTENIVDIGDVVGSEPSWFHFVITDGVGNEIWQYPWSIPILPPHLLSLESYESIEYQKIWNMMNENGTWFETDDFLVEPSVYNVMGELNLFSGERIPVSVNIQVIPEPGTIALLEIGILFLRKFV